MSKKGDFSDEKFSICIPKIQRDYAQGREDKGFIREELLGQIEEALNNKKQLDLDYIYGYMNETQEDPDREYISGKYMFTDFLKGSFIKKEEQKDEERFYPLDGQQRLTTLWLIYWYLAMKAGELSKEEKWLKKLVYETRDSTTEFCEELCNNKNFEAFQNKKSGVVDYIESQTWFYAAWKKDPTIKAMLTTIGGSQKNNHKDSIEYIFYPKNKDGTRSIPNKKEYYPRMLKNLKKNISFYVLVIDGEQLKRKSADDLYIRINARGRSLTDFANFKADLLSRSINYKDVLKDELIDFSDDTQVDIYLSEKINSEWNILFWNALRKKQKELRDNKKKGKKQQTIDEKAAAQLEDPLGMNTDPLLFSFINRFFFGRLCVLGDEEESGDKKRYLLDTKFLEILDELAEPDDESADSHKKEVAANDKKTRKTYREKLRELMNSDDEENKETVAALRAYDYYYNEHDLSYEDYTFYNTVILKNGEGLRALIKVLDSFAGSEGEKWIDIVNDCMREIVAKGVEKRGISNSASGLLPIYKRKPIYQDRKYIGEGSFDIGRDKGENIVGIVEGMELKDRAYFFGICKYFETNYGETKTKEHFEDCKEHFKDWMYFCRNVIENGGLESQKAMIECLRRLDECGAGSGDIIKWLSEKDAPEKPRSKIDAQIREEIWKAQHIWEAGPCDEAKRDRMKDRIREMEDYSFFCGAIRFLFTTKATSKATKGGKGDGLKDDWNQFGERSTTLKHNVGLRNNKVNPEFARVFAKQFSGFEEESLQGLKIFHTIGWDSRNDSWMNVLCDPKLISKVEGALTSDSTKTVEKDYETFVESDIFLNVVKKESGIATKMTDVCITKRPEGFVLAKKSSEYNKIVFDDDTMEKIKNESPLEDIVVNTKGKKK